MKKLFYLVCISTLSLFFFESCEKEEDIFINQEQVDAVLSEKEIREIKTSEVYGKASLAVIEINRYLEELNIKYDELLKFAIDQKPNQQIDSKILVKNLDRELIIEYTLKFDYLIDQIYNLNEKISKSKKIQQFISDEIFKNSFTIKKIIKNNIFEKTSSSTPPTRYIPSQHIIIPMRSFRDCFRRGGFLVFIGHKFYCVKYRYISSDGTTSSNTSMTSSTNTLSTVNITGHSNNSTNYFTGGTHVYNPYRYQTSLNNGLNNSISNPIITPTWDENTVLYG